MHLCVFQKLIYVRMVASCVASSEYGVDCLADAPLKYILLT